MSEEDNRASIPANEETHEFIRVSIPVKEVFHMGECIICLENDAGKDAVELQCGHQFHFDCIEEWNRRHRTILCV